MKKLQGQMAFTAALVLAITVGVSLLVGAYAYGAMRGQMTGVMDQLQRADFNTSIDAIDSSSYAAFSLGSVVIIVIAAIGIVSVILIMTQVG